MDNMKKVDCVLLPPCSKTLWNKTQRSNYIGIMRGNADTSDPVTSLNPLDYGWMKGDDCYEHNWFPGSALPDNLFDEDSEIDEEVINSETEWSDDEEEEGRDEYT